MSEGELPPVGLKEHSDHWWNENPDSSGRTGTGSDQEHCQPFGLRKGGSLIRMNFLSGKDYE